LPGAHFDSAIERYRVERSAIIGKAHQTHGRRRRLQRHAQQLQEFSAVALRNLICAIEQVLGQEGEQLDQGDARIALVEIRPFRIVNRNARQRFVQQILVATIID
jgi:hypothetical protein